MKRQVAGLWGVVMVLALLVSACAAGATQDDADAAELRIAVMLDEAGIGWADSDGSRESLHEQVRRGLLQVAEAHNGFFADRRNADRQETDRQEIDFGNQVELALAVVEAGSHGHEQRLRSMASAGYQLVIGVGMGFSEAVVKVARDLPETHFVLVEGELPDAEEQPNLTVVQFAENEGAFLAGALAGMMLPDLGGGSLGFITAMDLPQTRVKEAGFTAGVMFANSDLRTSDAVVARSLSQDPTAFQDPPAAAEAARELYGDGVRIIFHSAGASSEGIFVAAYEQRRWAIGASTDQGIVYAEANTAQERAIGERIVTSVLKRFDSVLARVCDEFIESGGALGNGYRRYGIADEAFSLAVNRFNDELLAPYRERLAEMKELVSSGDLSVPQVTADIEAWAEGTF